MRVLLLILVAIAIVKANADIDFSKVPTKEIELNIFTIPTQDIDVNITVHEVGWNAAYYCYGRTDVIEEVFKRQLQELFIKAGGMCAPARPAEFKKIKTFKYECSQEKVSEFDLELTAQFTCIGNGP